MNSSKIIAATMTLAILCLMAGSATAAQSGQQRVLTNDDVATTAPVPEKSADSGSSAAPAAPATSPGPSNAPSDASVASPSAPQSQLEQFANIVNVLAQATDILSDKINEGGADEATLARWHAMRDSLVDSLREFRGFADRARAAAPAAQPQQPKPESQQPPQQESGGPQAPTGNPAGTQ